MKFQLYPVILSGGVGSRLWPLSRGMYPKQYHNLENNYSLLQNTYLRLKGINNTSGHKSITYLSHQTLNPYVVCIHQQNKSHYVGSFSTLEMAIKARDKKGKKLYGKFYNP